MEAAQTKYFEHCTGGDILSRKSNSRKHWAEFPIFSICCSNNLFVVDILSASRITSVHESATPTKLALGPVLYSSIKGRASTPGNLRNPEDQSAPRAAGIDGNPVCRKSLQPSEASLPSTWTLCGRITTTSPKLGLVTHTATSSSGTMKFLSQRSAKPKKR